MDNQEKLRSIIKGIDPHPLFILEMANNHMGDVEHGLKIIRDFYAVTQKYYNFNFAIKFQFRNIDTFIHPDYKNRDDHKYVKRFQETGFDKDKFSILKQEAEKLGFLTLCTPFDEASVDLIEQMGFDGLKIASCSFTDWPLLEKISQTKLPLIASTGGVKLEDIDKAVSFWQNREKTFALMHCVGQYPTAAQNLQLNQIDFLRDRYDGVNVGYSTHEEPDNYDAVKVAVGKGVNILEKHVAVVTDQYEKNAYSATPDQVDKWLAAAALAKDMCGISGERHQFMDKELADIRQFQRGAFAKREIKVGEQISPQDLFFAFPNQAGQLVANDISKYNLLTAQTDISLNAPIMPEVVSRIQTREKVYAIVSRVAEFLKQAQIQITNKLDFELSHHYGIDKFYQWGAVIISFVNREYCKKLIVLLPNQSHPTHFHEKKEETFHVLHGEMTLELNGEVKECSVGDIVTVERGISHNFKSTEGCVFEEVSTTHYKNDSFYADEVVANNPNRKTLISYWLK